MELFDTFVCPIEGYLLAIQITKKLPNNTYGVNEVHLKYDLKNECWRFVRKTNGEVKPTPAKDCVFFPDGKKNLFMYSYLEKESINDHFVFEMTDKLRQKLIEFGVPYEKIQKIEYLVFQKKYQWGDLGEFDPLITITPKILN